MAWPVVYYVTEAGRCPCRDFLDDLSAQHAAQIVADLVVLGRDGLRRAPISKRPIKGRIGGFRIFLVEHASEIVVLDGCRKDRQVATIKNAARRMSELLRR